MSDLIVKFTHSTNDYMMMQYGGVEGTLIINDTAWLERDERFMFGTSMLESAAMEGDELVLKTVNSVYRFKVLSGSLQQEHIEAIARNKDDVKQLRDLNAKQYPVYVCTVGGNFLIDGALSIVALPRPMSRVEALEYVRENVVFSVSGDIVIYVNHPLSDEQLEELGYRYEN